MNAKVLSFMLIATSACSPSKHVAQDLVDGQVPEATQKSDGSALGPARQGADQDMDMDMDAAWPSPEDGADTAAIDAREAGVYRDADLADAGTPEGARQCAPSLVLEKSTFDVHKVDLLLAIDNSESMAEEQQKISAVLPNLVGILMAGTGAATPASQGTDQTFLPSRACTSAS